MLRDSPPCSRGGSTPPTPIIPSTGEASVPSLSETDHILEVLDLSRRAQAAEKSRVTTLRKRNDAIRRALAAGVSDRALAIAATLNRTMIWMVSTRDDAPHAQTVDVTDVHAINAVYPCCNRQAKFADKAATVESVQRYCRECRTNWIVYRSTVVETARGRVDILRWENPADIAA